LLRSGTATDLPQQDTAALKMKIKLINTCALSRPSWGKEEGYLQFLLMIPGTYAFDPKEGRVGTDLVELAYRNEVAR
jgi:hypothetical protein